MTTNTEAQVETVLTNSRHYIGRAGTPQNPDRWRVYVQDGNAYRQLTHHVYHSPTGFAWGYAGSGPAELARCILADAVGFDASSPEKTLDNVITPSLYQRFKEEKIATIPQHASFDLARDDVLVWLGTADAEVLERLRAPRHNAIAIGKTKPCGGRVRIVDDADHPSVGRTFCDECFDEIAPSDVFTPATS